MSSQIVFTRRIPKQALRLLRGAGELWLNPDGRSLSRDELQAADAGAGGSWQTRGLRAPLLHLI